VIVVYWAGVVTLDFAQMMALPDVSRSCRAPGDVKLPWDGCASVP
jgi:hypothetical protein